jgi:hypothetical protein
LADLKKRLRALLGHRLTQIQPLDPNKTYPAKLSWLLLISLGLVGLEWIYFYSLVPYDTIPGKLVFWLAFIGWATPTITAEWMYRNLPTRRQIDKYGNLFIIFGLSGLVFAVAARRVDALRPVAYAIMPGGMAGGLISSNMAFFRKRFKGANSGKGSFHQQ